MTIPSFVKRPIVATFHKAVQWNLAWDGREYRYIFILAHGRSGSSLLGHVLASHPEFMGAGETHTTYRNAADLQKLIPRTCQLLRTMRLKGKFVVDKINLDQYLTSQTLASLPIGKCLILIRAPEATLKSLSRLFGWSEHIALEHYVSRLRTLTEFGRVLRDRAMLVVYDDLVDRTDETLTALTTFFEVDPPFTNQYDKSAVTGKMGDPSENIFLGRIVRTANGERGTDANIMAKAVNAFENCQADLRSFGVLTTRREIPSSSLSNGPDFAPGLTRKS